jgi:ribosomal protein L30/L7E
MKEPLLEATNKILKVKLFRGFIGLPAAAKEHARCIGLTKRFQTVYLRPAPELIGNLLKIKELVKVELVDQFPPQQAGPIYSKGYKVTGTFLPDAPVYRYRQTLNKLRD